VVVFIRAITPFFLGIKMDEQDVIFLKEFIKILDEVKFKDGMTGSQVVSYANKIQKYAQIIIKLEKQLKEKNVNQ
jgi:hypothetical protein